ncbi:MAG: DNA (cytosine-5-)-methyltransferase [Oscillospiraceae bacterium]|nr:DNA (cytosine-5-)-methyltransferase [Oscillospiraceae bacterium]
MFELIAFSEIDNNAVSAYCAVNDIAPCKNFGDIHNVSKATISDNIDLLVGGTPCQDFSTAGQGAGCMYCCDNCRYSFNPLTISQRNRNNCPLCGKRIENKTRSSLLLEYLRIVHDIKPKFFIWENVLSVCTHKKYRTTFDLFLSELKSYGYNIYIHKTNAIDYGIPQHRQRIFILGIQTVFDTGTVTLTNKGYRNIAISDILQSSHKISDNLWLSDEGISDNDIIQRIYNPCTRQKVLSVYNKVGYLPQVFALRNSADLQRIPCITTNSNSPSGDGAIIIKQQNRIRKISALECFLAMGFNVIDYEKIQQLNLSDRVVRQFAGNSIVTDVLVALFRDLYNSQPHLFSNNLKVLSVCSGIGAFEYALKQFYNDYYNYTTKQNSEFKYTAENCLLQFSDMILTTDVCTILGVHRNTLHNLILQNKLNRAILNNKHYISKSSLIAYLNNTY